MHAQKFSHLATLIEFVIVGFNVYWYAWNMIHHNTALVKECSLMYTTLHSTTTVMLFTILASEW